MEKEFLKQASPDSLGVCSDNIHNYINHLNALEIDMHSVLISRRGFLIYEGYAKPFGREVLHRMFSVTKSLTAMSVIALITDGLVDIDKPVSHYFQEYPTPHKYTAEATVRNLLMMRSPHEKTTYKKNIENNWVESFFIEKPTHKPGTVFSYDTSAAHVLAALTEKLSGMDMIDYARSRFLNKTGFSKEAYILKDPQGVSIGGSGLMAYPSDVMRLGMLILNGGRWGGEQLLDEKLVRLAASCLSSTDVRGGYGDERQGYGMQIWRTRNNGFMLYGLGGQLALCLPDKDIILVTTADVQGYNGGLELIIDSFFRDVYDKIEDGHNGGGNALYEEFELPKLSGKAQSFCGDYRFQENAMGLKTMRIETNSTGGRLIYENTDGKHTLDFGYTEPHRAPFPVYLCDSITSGGWVEENRLIIKSRFIGEIVGSVTMELYVRDEYLTISSRKEEGSGFSEYNGIAQALKICQ